MDKDMRMKIELTPHNFIAYPVTPLHLQGCRGFARGYVSWSEFWNPRTKRMIREPKAGHIFFNRDRTQIRGLRTLFEEFKAYLGLEGILEGQDYYVEEKTLTFDLSDCVPNIREGWSPRGEQPDIIDFCTDGKNPVKIVHAQTGLGKSYILMEVAKKLQQRFCIIMRPFLIGEDENSGWIKDFAKTYDIDWKKDVVVVAGRKKLVDVITRAQEGTLHEKVIVFSNKTIQNYLTDYETHTDEEFLEIKGFTCKPQDLIQTMGVDTLFMDEIHFDYHLNCKILSYFQMRLFVGASGTIKSDDKFVERMFGLMYPMESRYKQKEYNVYAQPHSYRYALRSPERIKYMGAKGYSHNRLEKSVMRYVPLKRNYFDMVHEILVDFHNPKLEKFKDENLKALVYCASIDMCTDLATWLQTKYPDKSVKRFVEDDPDSNLFESDIAVSTIFSAGTGQDIPRLGTVVMTTAISATSANLQALGRLRDLSKVFPDKDIPLDFVYLTCTDIMKHNDYDRKKQKEIFVGKALPVKNIDSGKVI